MKSSEILRKALERMDGGKKWVNHEGDRFTTFCAANALSLAAQESGGDPWAARDRLNAAVGTELTTTWNDSAADFSVIQQGFERAISLAEAEGD